MKLKLYVGYVELLLFFARSCSMERAGLSAATDAILTDEAMRSCTGGTDKEDRTAN